METPSRRRSAAPLPLVLALVAMSAIGAASAQRKHDVGKPLGFWAPGVNFTDWAAKEQFYVGDWLVFRYQKGYYDVVQVNETDYERCSAEHPIRNDSRGSSYAFQLNSTGPYYFICSRGQCWGGMKLAIDVQPLPFPAPSPSSTSSSATLSSEFAAGGSRLWVSLVVIIAGAFLLTGF